MEYFVGLQKLWVNLHLFPGFSLYRPRQANELSIFYTTDLACTCTCFVWFSVSHYPVCLCLAFIAMTVKEQRWIKEPCPGIWILTGPYMWLSSAGNLVYVAGFILGTNLVLCNTCLVARSLQQCMMCIQPELYWDVLNWNLQSKV